MWTCNLAPLFLFVSVSLSSLTNCHAHQRPNIVIILADDLGWDDVGFHGSQQIPTPNLDSLAYDGVILGNYYVQPICTPSRAALLTGRYPIHLGLQHDVLNSAQPYGLPLNETLFPQYLKPLGYRSHIVGKWHLGFFKNDYLPTRRGFDSHYGYYQGAGDYYDHTCMPVWPDDHKSWGFDFHRNMELEFPVFGKYSTELFITQTETIIAQHNASEPLFLYVAHQAVHSGNPNLPLVAPKKYVDKVSHIKSKTRRLYGAMVSALDDSVGNLTRALHTRGMLNNTIIVFSTDNGGPAHGFNRNDASNWPLRGLKHTLWEGGVRGVGFVWSPLLRKSGFTSYHLMHITDWLPTLMHAATDASRTESYQPPKDIDGIDQWNVLSNDDISTRSEVLLNIDPVENSKAIRVGDMKLIADKHGYTRHCAGWYPPDEYDADLASSPCDNNFDIHSGDEYLRSGPGNMEERSLAQSAEGESVEGTKFSHGRNQNDENLASLWRRIHNRFRDETSQLKRNYVNEMSQRDSEIDFGEIFEQLGRGGGRQREPVAMSPLVVQCRPRPVNLSMRCEPWVKPCLFNITSDPCEFENMADIRPEIVEFLSKRIEFYERSARKPLNVPVDDAGLPYHHHWTWVPWVSDASNSDNLLT